MSRFFRRSERAVLYIAAGGKCSQCREPLTDGWHADHIRPFSKGGMTDLSNGQALCPPCNLSKGTTMNAGPYSDAFEPRDFQARLISTVLDRYEAGERLTVAVASPGSGKTLAYQAIATELIRAGVIDYVAAYAPRIALAAQCEIEYRSADDQGHYSLFDPAARLESIQHRENKPPLTQPGAKRVGYVTTYASLVTDPAVHLDWARKHEGRFLLVGDEAQFLGSDDEDEQMGGTKAGGHFRELSDYAAHTILLTGTEKRADGKRLVLAQYEERDGYEYLQADERATHSDGM